MPVYVEYPLEDGTLLVKISDDEVVEGSEGFYESALTDNDTLILKSKKRFGEALKHIVRAVPELKKELLNARADEVEVKFGLVSTGKLGSFAIAEVGIEANFEVTLKWKNTPEDKKP